MTTEKPMDIELEVRKVESKEDRHRDLCTQIHDTYIKKNHDYGDSFGKSFQDWGITAAAVRIEDKFNRFKNLAKGAENMVADERMEDTLLDMANYCIMTVLELQEKTNNEE